MIEEAGLVEGKKARQRDEPTVHASPRLNILWQLKETRATGQHVLWDCLPGEKVGSSKRKCRSTIDLGGILWFMDWLPSFK